MTVGSSSLDTALSRVIVITLSFFRDSNRLLFVHALKVAEVVVGVVKVVV